MAHTSTQIAIPPTWRMTSRCVSRSAVSPPPGTGWKPWSTAPGSAGSPPRSDTASRAPCWRWVHAGVGAGWFMVLLCGAGGEGRLTSSSRRAGGPRCRGVHGHLRAEGHHVAGAEALAGRSVGLERARGGCKRNGWVGGSGEEAQDRASPLQEGSGQGGSRQGVPPSARATAPPWHRRRSRLCCAWRFMLRVCRLGCADRPPRPGEDAREDEADAGGRPRGSGGRPLSSGGGAAAGACCCWGGCWPAWGAPWGGAGPGAVPGAPGIALVVRWGRCWGRCGLQARSDGQGCRAACWMQRTGAGAGYRDRAILPLKGAARWGLLARCGRVGRCRE